MNFLARIFGRGAVPEWASFFTAREYNRFMKCVESTLNARGFPHRISDGVVEVQAPGCETQHFGLLNLAQLCKMRPAEEWDRLTEAHFTNVLSIQKEREALEAEMKDYSRVRHMLKIRLFPENIPDEVKQNAVGRFIAPGIIAMLAFDLPSTVATVGRKDVEAWGLSEEQLLRDALANIETSEPVKPEVIDSGDGLRVYTVSGDSFFTASHILLLEKHLPGRFEHGALVIVPTRHHLIFHPIEGAPAVRAVNALLPMAYDLHREGPGAITPGLYWWRDGELTLLPSAVEKGALQFYPPDEFVELLNRLVQK